MTNLEFINKKIKDGKESIKYWKGLLEKYPDEEVFTIGLNKCKEELQTLQQIKNALEAWETVKDKIDITEYYNNEQDYEEDTNPHNALCLNSNLKIQNSNNEDEWFIPLENKESNKLKKALEEKE